jgi:hypothetical protein
MSNVDLVVIRTISRGTGFLGTGSHKGELAIKMANLPLKSKTDYREDWKSKDIKRIQDVLAQLAS